MDLPRLGARPTRAFALLLAACLTLPANADVLRTPDASAPPILATLQVEESLLAFALRADGRAAALAVPHPDKESHSVVRLHSLDAPAPREAIVQAVVLDLIFSPDGSAVFGISYRGKKKKRVADTYLFSVDFETTKFRQHNRLPPTARDLDIWVERGAMLIASVDEVRTVLFDGLRSGPLYRVVGRNLAVASLGGSLILLGREDGLLIVDLDDAPGSETMPNRGSYPTDAPMVRIAVARDGTTALARDVGGQLYDVAFTPLRAEALAGESALPVAAQATAAQRRPPAVPPPAPTVAAAEPRAPREAPPAPAPQTSQPAPQTPEPATPATDPAATAEEAARAATAAAVLPPPDPAPAKPAPLAKPSANARLWGRLAGPAADAVAEVVLFGPDNLLEEALRVAPRDHLWEVTDLAPGRYRVQVDGGGDRVLVARPGFLVVEVDASGTVQAPDCEIVRVVEPGALN